MEGDYQHLPLKSDDSIRLLDLLPSFQRGAPVQCRIRQVKVDQARSAYEALSYVWGDPQGSRPILCDGRKLLVTPNCHDALVQLRHRFRARTLWIDAICIDQSAAQGSTRERNAQVRQMGEIYRQASTVLVWLGREELKVPAEYWLLLLASATATAVHFAAFSSTESTLERYSVDVTAYLGIKLLMCEGKHHFITKTCENQWFTRVWTVQECAFARKCIVVSGTKKMKWSTMHFVSNVLKEVLLMHQDESVRSALSMIQLRSFAQELATDGGRYADRPQADISERALEFLRSIRNQDSSLPHDKVYGVHSILRKMKIQLSDPDYSEPLESVVEDLTRACISSLQLDVVTSGLPTTEPPERPSWIANYLVPESRRGFAGHVGAEFPDRSGAMKIFRPFKKDTWCDASAGSKAYVATEDVPGRLQVRGTRMGLLTTVLACASENESDTTEIEAFRDFLHACREWCHVCSALPNGDVLFMNSFCFEDKGFGLWRDVILYPECSEEARRIIRESTPFSAQTDPITVLVNYLQYSDKYEARNSAWHFQYQINVGANWAFVKTDSGHTGRAYRSCREGDQLWLLAGSRVPVILRAAADGYRYIAPAYFCDMMEGQLWPDSEGELETLDLV